MLLRIPGMLGYKFFKRATSSIVIIGTVITRIKFSIKHHSFLSMQLTIVNVVSLLFSMYVYNISTVIISEIDWRVRARVSSRDAGMRMVQ